VFVIGTGQPVIEHGSYPAHQVVRSGGRNIGLFAPVH
jgi:hypothetical protein